MPSPYRCRVLDQLENLEVCRGLCSRKIVEQTENLAATRQLAQREFADHPRMGQHVNVMEKRRQRRFTNPEVVDPYRGVDENHARLVCRLGVPSAPGSLPAS